MELLKTQHLNQARDGWYTYFMPNAVRNRITSSVTSPDLRFPVLGIMNSKCNWDGASYLRQGVVLSSVHATTKPEEDSLVLADLEVANMCCLLKSLVEKG